jgi:trimethylamine--corrinoid protein Co-methyltransferase
MRPKKHWTLSKPMREWVLEIGVALWTHNPQRSSVGNPSALTSPVNAFAAPKVGARKLCATAPSTFIQPSPERSVTVGGNNLVLAPVYSRRLCATPGGRRYLADCGF